MTFRQVIEGLQIIAQELGAGYTGAFDIAEVNQKPDIKYPLFYITTEQITKNLDVLTVTVRLVYGEQLNDSQDNWLDIQSAGVEFLSKVINRFREEYDAEIGDYSYQVYVQRFADVLTGVLSTVSITVEGEGSC